MPNDMDDLVEGDKKKARRAYKRYKKEGWKPSAAKALEHTFWALCLLSVVFIVGTLPWVGEDKLITGEQWMGLGTMGLVGFGFMAMVIRLVSRSFEDADKSMSEAFERGR